MPLAFIFDWKSILHGVLPAVVGVALAQLVHHVFYGVLERLSIRRRGDLAGTFGRCTANPFRLLLTLFALTLTMSFVNLSAGSERLFQHVLEALYIGAFTWLAIGSIAVLHHVIVRRLPENTQHNIPARRVRTQVNLFRQIANGLVFFLGAITLLMTFPAVRNLGAGLFASAGVAGLVLGIAARPTLGNLIAGIQIAVTESVRIGDSVVVEGEFGQVVEVNTTSVVIRLWDLRHLIVPVSYFVEKTFQNWTRYSSDLIGAVHLQLHYMVRVEKLRAQYEAILDASPLWDRKMMLVQVTDAKEATVEVRFLMSAASAADTFAIRCYVRESMLAYLQDNYPEALPRSRSEVSISGSFTPTDTKAS